MPAFLSSFVPKFLYFLTWQLSTVRYHRHPNMEHRTLHTHSLKQYVVNIKVHFRAPRCYRSCALLTNISTYILSFAWKPKNLKGMGAHWAFIITSEYVIMCLLLTGPNSCNACIQNLFPKVWELRLTTGKGAAARTGGRSGMNTVTRRWLILT